MRGIIPSLHTPFCRDNKVDILSLQKLIDHTIVSGCAGMLVGAVAGENASLSLDEKETIINACVKHNNNRLPLIVSCSANNQYDRITLSRAAKVAGADWILCQTPNNLNGNELTECFNEIADVGPSNLMIQDLSWTDNGMNDEDILLLFENIKKFKGLKIEVLNSGPKYSRILKATNHKLHLSGGWAIMGMIEALNRGVHAFIPSTMEVIYNEIYNLFIEKKINGTVLGPVSAPIFRLKRKFRIRILIRGSKSLKLQNSLANIIPNYKFPSGIKLSVDVDPINFN